MRPVSFKEFVEMYESEDIDSVEQLSELFGFFGNKKREEELRRKKEQLSKEFAARRAAKEVKPVDRGGRHGEHEWIDTIAMRDQIRAKLR